MVPLFEVDRERSGEVPRLFRESDADKVRHLPTPEQISVLTAQIRAGQRVGTRRSQKRWLAESSKMRDAREDAADSFDLAGRIDDDSCELPPWLYSAGRRNV